MVKFVIFSFMAVVVCGENSSYVTPEQSAIIKSKLTKSGMSCFWEIALPMAVKKGRKGPLFDDEEILFCFSACALEKIGVINDMGYFDATGFRNLGQEVFKNDIERLERTEKIIQNCSSINYAPTTNGVEMCQFAKLTISCLIKSAKTNKIDIEF